MPRQQNEPTGQEAAKPDDAQREPLPLEFREFTNTIRDLFRETKKLIIFIRNSKNTNAALVVLTFLLAIAAFTQAVIYGIQLGPLRRSANAANSAADTTQKTLTKSIDAFRIDERAWVEIGKIEKTTFPPSGPFGTVFKFAIYPKNVGKTVAQNVRIHIDNVSDWGSFGDNEHAIRMFQDQLFTVGVTTERSITPDKPGPQTVAPNDLSPVPVYSGGEGPRGYGNDFRYTFILGRIDYIDAFGIDHWKHFCFTIYDSRGELAHCQYGNDEDNNSESAPTK